MLPRLRTVGINVLIATILAIVLIEALPQSPPAVRSAIQPLSRAVGLKQSWGLFSPPDRMNTRLRAEITYADGRTATWRSPDWPDLSPWQRFCMHRRSEWLDNVWNSGNSPVITSWARFLARSQRPSLADADRGAEVKIIVEQAPIPPANMRPWKTCRTRIPFEEATTLAIEKLP